MRSRLVAVLAAIVVTAGPAAAAPVAGTCTLSGVRVIARSLGLSFPVPEADGIVLPVTVDAAAGTIAVDRTGWMTVHFATLGIPAALDLPHDVVTGTIDGNGNVVVPHFTLTFTTNFCTPACVLNAEATLASVFEQVSFAGKIQPTRGVPLDFATGVVVLEGHQPLADAPGGGSTTGLHLTCALAPIPDAAALPAGATLSRARGVVKIGPPLPDTAPADGDPAGDRLKLAATLGRGARPLDPSEDLYVALDALDGTALAALFVPGGTLHGRKTLKVVDTDGTAIVVLAGRKANQNVNAALAGKLSLKTTKRGVVLKLAHQGLDLSGTAAGARLTVQMGDQATRRDLVAKVGRKATKLR
jgi:hypothetical protein